MIIYIAQIVWVFAGKLITKYSYKWNKISVSGESVYLVATFLFLGIVSALRASSVGSDTLTYYHMYEKIANADSIQEAITVSTISAPVYVVYAYILSRFFVVPQIITAMNSAIIAIGMAQFIKKTSPNYMASICLFIGLTMYYDSMNGARQFIAVVLMLNAYCYFIDDLKSKRGWIYTILAIGIHNTAIIFLVSLLGLIMIKRQWSIKKIFLITIFVGGGICLTFNSLVYVFLNYFPQYVMYINGKNPASILEESGSGRIILLYIVLFSISLLYMLSKPKEINPMFPGTVFGSIVGIIFCRNVLINRLVWYFLGFFIPFIPVTFNNFNQNTRRLLYIGYFIAIGIYCAFHLMEDKGNILPYITFLSE